MSKRFTGSDNIEKKAITTKQIERECIEAGFSIEKREVEMFSLYITELMEWNKRTNLTAIKSEVQILRKLIIPSLGFSRMLPTKEKKKVLDFGSGAGFPGIPLKIAFPELEITLLDSIGKKVRFLLNATQALGLNGSRCINERGENFVKRAGEGGSYDYVTAMAVASLTTLSKYGFPFLKTGGRLITLKGERLDSEMEELKRSEIDYKVETTREFAPQNATPYTLISIQKCST